MSPQQTPPREEAPTTGTVKNINAAIRTMTAICVRFLIGGQNSTRAIKCGERSIRSQVDHKRPRLPFSYDHI